MRFTERRICNYVIQGIYPMILDLLKTRWSIRVTLTVLKMMILSVEIFSHCQVVCYVASLLYNAGQVDVEPTVHKCMIDHLIDGVGGDQPLILDARNRSL